MKIVSNNDVCSIQSFNITMTIAIHKITRICRDVIKNAQNHETTKLKSHILINYNTAQHKNKDAS